MSVPVRPILSALLRNWTGPVLVASQIAIALAVLVNAVYVVQQRIEKIGRPTGMDVPNIFLIRSLGITERFAHETSMREDLDYLRSVPGVVAAAPIDYAPLSGQGGRIGVMLQPEDQAHAVGTGYYETDQDAVAALGVKLVAGRLFRENEILPPRSTDAPWTPVRQVIVTQALANDLFPNGDALGKTLYDSFGLLGSPATIVGIVERMHGSRVSWDRVDRVLLAPRLPFPDEEAAVYIVRTEPGQRDRVMRAVEERMLASNPDRMIEWIRPLEHFKDRSYRADRNMGIFLVFFTTLLLGITSIGIFGLATFNVATRTKQIGTRRALGARRLDIVNYFLVENWLMTTAGVIAGSGLALGAGYWLSLKYQLPRLDLYYLAGGIPVLWVLGLLAAWLPARRAASVSPAVATRTV